MQFSPNEKQILFSYFKNGKGHIYTSNINGSELNLLAKPEKNFSYSHPKYSKDGSKILFIEFSLDGQNNSLYILDSKKTTEKLKIREKEFIREAIFMNEGSKIVYCKAQELSQNSPIGNENPHKMDIYFYDVDKGIETKITSLNAYSISYLNRVGADTILFNLDNENICYVNINSPGQISYLKLNETPMFIGDISYSEKQKKISYADSYNIYLTDVWGGESRKVLGPNNFQINNLILMNNFDRIAFTKALNNNKFISFINVDTSDYSEVNITIE